jgi:hypothetical protein
MVEAVEITLQESRAGAKHGEHQLFVTIGTNPQVMVRFVNMVKVIRC